MIGINRLFEFQKKAVSWIIEKLDDDHAKKTIKLKAPTGSGKTIILLSVIEKYLIDHPNTAFVWLCPGKGNLEEQSKHKMEGLLPGYSALSLFDAIQDSFPAGSTTFVNWELVTKKGNRALTDSEKKNLKDAIRQAELEARQFIIIIDEEHTNNTKKADNLIDDFRPTHIIRASATTIDTGKRAEFYEIPEEDVIDEELITKSIRVNLDVDGQQANAATEYKYLIDIANAKREELTGLYRFEHEDIRPLVLIQLPDKSDELKNGILDYLEELGFTVGNKLVAVWLDKQKENLDGIEKNNADPIFLIMKQAVATGWDCPRAKILIKLRENMGESFTIQTVGRIRRMPLHKFHASEDLNHSYVYTFDSKFKEGLLENVEKAYELRRFFLKKEFEGFQMYSVKKIPTDTNTDRMKILKIFFGHLKDKYKLDDRNFTENRVRMQRAGYRFLGNLKEVKVFSGEVVKTSDMNADNLKEEVVLQPVQTHDDGRSLMHIIDVFASRTRLENPTVRLVMRRLFFKDKKRKKKYRLLDLTNTEFYAFVINNEHKLKIDWLEAVTEGENKFREYSDKTNRVEFHMPPEQFYAVNPLSKAVYPLPANTYKDYSSETFIARSMPEQLFEKWCNNSPAVKWFYKNGDHGEIYFSVVYTRSIDDEKEFYPDYLMEDVNGKIWIIETKGGENKYGIDRNIDKYSKVKFEALKVYADMYGYNWGFVREIGSDLFINNEVYSEDMGSDYWKPINTFFEQ